MALSIGAAKSSRLLAIGGLGHQRSYTSSGDVDADVDVGVDGLVMVATVWMIR